MAAIDSLLRIIQSQNADALSLAAEQPPRLSRAGLIQPLSMPPLSAAMLETFVAEVLAPPQLDEARSAPVTVDYGEYTATAALQPTGWALSFKKRRPAPRGAAPGPAIGATPPPPPVPVVAAAPPAPVADAASAPLLPPAHAAPVHAGSPGMSAATRWLTRAIDEHASDVIISAGIGARLRFPDTLADLPGAALGDDDLLALLAPSLTPPHREQLARHGATDLAFVLPSSPGERPARFRVNLFRQTHGLTAVFRPVRRDPPSLAELGLPDSLTRLASYPNGLVLVVGPTGSGKSTTLVSLVEHLNLAAARHIITLEDPIEYEFTSRRSLVHQREVGAHVDSFDSGLRSALREAPDVILVGEMRDRATVSAALTAAETGHLVLSSLHAAGAAMAVERIVDVFPEHQQRQVRGQLAGVLRAILTQHLLPRVGGGRVPAVELAICTAAVGALIRDGKTHQLSSAIQTGRDDGMVPLDRSLAERVERREVTLEAAAAVASDGGAQLRELLGRGRTR